MITALQIRAMRAAMQEKLASRAVRRGDLEGMSKARWKQTAKDLPVVALGSGLGYATGRVLGDAVAERFLQGSPKEQKILSYAIPITSSMVSAMGAYTLGQQRALMRQRRDEADALAGINKTKKSYAMTGSTFTAGPTKPNYPDFTRDHAKARRVNKRELPPVEDEEGFFWAGDDE